MIYFQNTKHRIRHQTQSVSQLSASSKMEEISCQRVTGRARMLKITLILVICLHLFAGIDAEWYDSIKSWLSYTPNYVSSDLVDYFRTNFYYPLAAECNVTTMTDGTSSCMICDSPGIAKSVVVQALNDPNRELDNFAGGNAGFIGLNPSKTDILVVIPGTHGLKEWVEDFDILQRAINIRNANSTFTSAPAGARIHDGFHRLFDGVYQQVRQVVSTLVKSGKYSKVRFVGYSLGGPVATLLSVDALNGYLRDAQIDIELITFGCPRHGNAEYARWASKLLEGKSYRVTDRNDPVPLVPVGPDWMHVVAEFFVTEGGQTLTPRIVQCSSDSQYNEDLHCSTSVNLLDLRTSAHHYFGLSRPDEC